MHEPDSLQLAAMQAIWDRFQTNGSWPAFDEVDRALYREFDVEMSALLAALSPSLVLFDPRGHPQSHVSLTLAGIVRCDGTASDVALCLAAVRWCVAAERSHEPEDAEGDSLRVTADDMRSGLTEAAHIPSSGSLNRVFAILSNEGVFSGSSGPNPGAPDEWSFTLDRRIRRFKDVGTLEDLLEATERRPATIVTNVEAPDAPRARLDKATAPVAARQIFVIMPFSETWSDSVYTAIRSGCATGAPEEGVRVIRADELTQTGNITEQIVQSIVAADIVVADVTDTNPNVMYELGYADALNKTAILLNQDVAASPFDIQVLRQIAYTPDDLAAVVTRLREFVRTAFGTPDSTIGEQEPRQPAALAPTVLRPAVDHGPGPFNMPSSGEFNCWLTNDGPSTVEIGRVRMHHQSEVLAGYLCAHNGEPLDSSIVPVRDRAHLQFASTPATAQMRNDTGGTLDVDVRFRDPRSHEWWWVTFVLRRGRDTGSRAQWTATSQIGPRAERDS